MNLDIYIRIMLIELCKDYKVSLMELQNVYEGRISKYYKLTLKELTDNTTNVHEFRNKRELVSWYYERK